MNPFTMFVEALHTVLRWTGAMNAQSEIVDPFMLILTISVLAILISVDIYFPAWLWYRKANRAAQLFPYR